MKWRRRQRDVWWWFLALSPPAAFRAALLEIEAQLIAASQAAAAAHPRQLQHESPRDCQGEVNQTEENRQEDRIDDEAAPDGMEWKQGRHR